MLKVLGLAANVFAVSAFGASTGHTTEASQLGSISIDALRRCAAAQVAECQFRLGQALERGEGVPRDLALAKRQYELAYQAGFEDAGVAILRIVREQQKIATDNREVQHPRSASNSTVAATSKDQIPGAHSATPPLQASAPQKPAQDSDQDGFKSEWGRPSTADPAYVNKWPTDPAAVGTTGAPRLFGSSLGQNDTDLLTSVVNPRCDAAPSALYRNCSGIVSTEIGELGMNAVLFKGHIEKIYFDSPDPDLCPAITALLTRQLGRPTGNLSRAGKAMFAAALSGYTRADMPSLTFWGKKRAWVIGVKCTPATPANMNSAGSIVSLSNWEGDAD